VLAVNDATIGLAADNIDLTTSGDTALTVADATIALDAESPTLQDVVTPAPPSGGGSGIGGGYFSLSSRRARRAVERAIDKALEEPEKKRRREARKVRVEKARRRIHVLREAEPEQLPPPPPPPIVEGRGKISVYRAETNYATLSPSSGSKGRLLGNRRPARYGRLEPRGIQNPTLEEIYLTTVLT